MKKMLSIVLALMMCLSLFGGISVSALDEATKYVYDFCPVGIDPSLYNTDLGDGYATYGSTALNPNWQFYSESTASGTSQVTFNGTKLSDQTAGEYFALKLRVPTKGTYSLSLTYATHNTYNKGETYLAPISVSEKNYFNASFKLCDTPCNSSSGSVGSATATISRKVTTESDNQEFIFILRRSDGYSAPVVIKQLVMTKEPDTEPVYADEYIYQFRYPEISGLSLNNMPVNEAYANYASTGLNENWKFEDEYYTSAASITGFNGLQTGSYKTGEWLALRLRVPTPGTYSLDYFYSTHKNYGVSELFLVPVGTSKENYFNIAYKIADANHKSTSTDVKEANVTPKKIITTTANNEEFLLVIRKSSTNPDSAYTRRFVLKRLDPATLTRKFDFQPDGGLVVQAVGVPDNYDTYEKTGRGWKYLDMHDDVKAAYANGYSTFRTLFYGLSFGSSKKGHFVKLGLNADFTGTYAATLKHYQASGGTNAAALYLAPASVSDPTAAEYKLGTANMRASSEGYAETPLSIVNIPANGEYIFTAKIPDEASGNVTMYLTSLDLAPISVTSATIVAEKTMPINSAQGVSLVTTVEGEEKALSGAEWTSTNTSVATVKDGIIRAVSDGNTIIKATFGNITATLPLTVTHPNPRVEDATTAKVYITAPAGVTLDVDGTLQGSQLDKAVGTKISATAPESAGNKDFKYWLNLSNGSVYSTDASVSFNLASNTSLMAVYAEKESGYLVEFANANREVIKSEYLAEGAAVVAPALPKLTGYGVAKEWSAHPEVVGKSDIQSVAQYDAPKTVSITVVGGTSAKATYDYNELVTVTANAASEGKVFSHWTRGGQIVSYSPTYSFYAWADATLTANYAASALSNFPAVIIDDATRTDGGNTAYMMELVGFAGKKVLERGFLFGVPGLDLHGGATYKAVSVLGANQFSAMAPESGATAVRAYVVYLDGDVIRIAYSAER